MGYPRQDLNYGTLDGKNERLRLSKCMSFAGIVDQERKYREKVQCESAALPFPEPNFKHKLVKWMED